MVFIKKDGLWLIGYREGLNSWGVPVCVWGERMEDAKVFPNKSAVKDLARAIGNCEVVTERSRRLEWFLARMKGGDSD